MYVIFFNLMAISKKNESPLFQTCRKPIEKMVQTIEAKRLTDRHIANVQEKVLSCGASRRYLHVKIILEIQLIENKEVTLLMQLNW